MLTDAHGRIRVRLKSNSTKGTDEYGWATSAPGNEFEPGGGYTVDWDDGYKDLDITRWYLNSGDMFELEAVYA